MRNCHIGLEGRERGQYPKQRNTMNTHAVIKFKVGLIKVCMPAGLAYRSGVLVVVVVMGGNILNNAMTQNHSGY